MFHVKHIYPSPPLRHLPFEMFHVKHVYPNSAVSQIFISFINPIKYTKKALYELACMSTEEMSRSRFTRRKESDSKHKNVAKTRQQAKRAPEKIM